MTCKWKIFSLVNTFIMKTTAFVIITVYLSAIDSYNILIAIDFPARSSFVFLNPLMKSLVQRGHNLTVISNFRQTDEIPNYKEILIDGVNALGDLESVKDLKYIEKVQFIYTYFNPMTFTTLSKNICELLFTSKEIQELLDANTKFDLVILNIFFSECIYQIVKKFESPIIGYHSTPMVAWAPEKLAAPPNPAIIPNVYMTFGPKMTFFERVENSLATWGHILYNHCIMVPSDKKIVEKYFGSEESEQLDKIRYNISLFLSNTHYTVNSPIALLPNIVEIGGIHIGKSGKLSEVRKIISYQYTKNGYWKRNSQHSRGIIIYSILFNVIGTLRGELINIIIFKLADFMISYANLHMGIKYIFTI